MRSNVQCQKKIGLELEVSLILELPSRPGPIKDYTVFLIMKLCKTNGHDGLIGKGQLLTAGTEWCLN